MILPWPTFAWVRELRRRYIDYALAVGLIFAGLSGIAYVTMPDYILPKTGLAATTIETPKPVETQKPIGMARSIPTRLEVPDAKVDTNLIQLGLNEDGSLETPSDYDVAGWYKYSPTPGEIGPAVITGHVDNYLGPAVFFYLKELQVGQVIKVTREDGSTVNFKVDRVELFSQNAFPTDEVYGNIDYPGLRLITCGGTYNAITGHYSDNVVVYATVISS